MKLLHIGVHNSLNKNAGDTLLFPVVRKIFDYFFGKCDWQLFQIWDEFSLNKVKKFNKDYDGIILGGGGSLLKDQFGSITANSGWQWNSSIKSINAIKIPLIIFAIGYNRFRNQSEFDPIFFKHISATIKKSLFFGLRNTGSINAVKKYINPDLHSKLLRQFCPTTCLWQLFPEYQKITKLHDKKKDQILSFNAAYDRFDLRFGSNSKEVISRIINSLKIAQTRGWKIIVTAHKTIDRKIEALLNEQGVLYETKDLTNASEDEVMKFYAQVDLAFGMRGHSQMIPFGLRRPIMSIISHDKMRFFLEDINRLEWGIEVNSLNFVKIFEEYLINLKENKLAIHSQLAQNQQKVWEETKNNFKNLKKLIKIQTKTYLLSK